MKKHNYRYVKVLKLTNYDMRVLVNALAYHRSNQIARGEDHSVTNRLILRLLDRIEAT